MKNNNIVQVQVVLNKLFPIIVSNGYSISARNLHLFFESKQNFGVWVKKRINKYNLIENTDFTTHKFRSGKNGASEYLLTLKAAIEITTLQRDTKGDQARKYFIERQSDLQSCKAIFHSEPEKLIHITEHNGERAVSARDLHAFLESKQDFSTWIKNRIEKYDLMENIDFEVFHNFVENPKGGRPLTEYILTMDAAKELSMVENNAKGKQARRYFEEYEANHKKFATMENGNNHLKSPKEESNTSNSFEQQYSSDELIPITENNGQQAVSARDLYEFLEVTERFQSWFNRQLQYGFLENEDYIGCKEFNTLANQELTNYILSMDCAKEISMLQRNSKGKQARRYFIEVEKRYRNGEREKTQRPPNLYDNAFVSVYVHELGALLRLNFIAEKGFWVKNILSLILLHGGKRCLEEYGYIFSSQEKAEFVQKQLNQMCYKFQVPLKSLNMVCRFGLKHSGLLDTYNKVYNLNYLS